MLQPLAAQRERIGGFINSASDTAAATAERRADLEASLQKLPGFLRELELTMAELDSFSERATPVVSDLGDAAPDLTRMTLALGPFAKGGTKALVSPRPSCRGGRARPAGIAPGPGRIVKRLAAALRAPATTLARLLESLEDRNAIPYLAQLIYNTSGAINAFDSYGHLLRALFPLNNCVDYVFDVSELACDADFTANEDPFGPGRAAAKEGDGAPTAAERRSATLHEELLEQIGAGQSEPAEPTEPSEPAASPGPDEPDGDAGNEPELEPPGEDAATPGNAPDMAGARLLLDYLIGAPEGAGGAGR